MTWNDITIRQYQLINSIPVEMDEMEKNCTLLSVVYGKPKDYYEGIKLSELIQEIKTLKFLKEPLPERMSGAIVLGGKVFHPKPNINTMTAEQFIILSKFTQSNAETITNLHQIMATVTQRIKFGFYHSWDKNFAEKVELMLDCPISKALPIALFFLKLQSDWLAITETYLENELTKAVKKLRLM